MEIASSQPPLAQALEIQRLILQKKAQTAEAVQALTLIEAAQQQQLLHAAAPPSVEPAGAAASSLFQQFA